MRRANSIHILFKLIWLVTLVAVATLVKAEMTAAYIVDIDSEAENIGNYTHYIEDKQGNLFLEDIIALPDASEVESGASMWKQAPPEGLAEGFTDSVYWLRFSVKNASEEDARWYLEFRYPILDSIEYFSPNEKGEYEKQVAGDSYPFGQRSIDYRNVVFAHNMEEGESNTYYVRVDTSSSMFVPLYIWPNDTFFHEIDKVKLLLGILYGIVALALFISAVNAIFLKDVMYIWLSGIFICFFLYLCGIKGVAFQSLWPESLYWQEVSIPFFMNMSYAFGFLYCRAYINLKELSLKLDLFIKALATLGFVAALLSLIVEYRYIISFSTVMTMLSQVICLSVGTYSWSKGNTAARLFVLSWTALFLGAVSFAMIALGAIPKTFITEWMQEIGFGSMVTLMIIAQFDRFLQIQKSHERNQEKSLEAVQNAEKKYRSLFENAIEGIFQMDGEGVLTNVNTAYARILGLDDAEHLVETRDTPFSLGFMSENEGNKLEALLNSQGALSDYNISFASPTGEIRWASIAIQRVNSGDNGNFHYEGSLTDITETKKREQAEKQRRMAEASTEAKSMFLANMSHEIRTPMNAIIGFTDLAVNANQDKNLSEFLRKIKTASSNLLGIINDILDFSKIEAGKLKIESIPFNLKELMNNIRDIVEGNIESKGLEFSIDIDEDIPEVLIGDSLRLHQILLNLTNNAVKFTPEGSVRVEIDLLAMNKKKGTIKLEGRVIDTGIGISQEKQDKLFTSFSQADESTTRTFGGTGLGLSISKQLISLMGGDINVRSIENQGSVFEFNFQCRLESRKQRFGNEETKLNILVIDDNADSTLLTESVINQLQHSYSCVNTTADAIGALKASQEDALSYDMILIDWLMPNSDGFECLEQIKSLDNFDLPKTALITSYGEDGLEERALSAGFDAYIEKPLKKTHLQQIIASLFGTSLSTRSKAASPPQKDTPVEETNLLDSPVGGEIDSENNKAVSNSGNFHGIRALLVEDVAMNQELAKEILRRQGIATTVANDGEQGVEAAKSESFDVILMDMQMPIMDGCEATIAIREFNQDIPIIAMTANAMSEDKKRCLNAGMNDFVTKPINDKALFSTLAKHLSLPDAEPQQAQLDVQDEPTSEQAENETIQAVEPEPTLAEATSSESESESETEQETPPPSENGELPERLPSIDLRDGLERCQGNQKLYLKLLGDFIRNYGQCAVEMQEMLERQELTPISKLAHTFKGLSANLGAKEISSHAMKLERISDLSDSEQVTALDKFKAELGTLVQDLEALLAQAAEQNNESADKKAVMSQEERVTLIEALGAMINEQKMDAYDTAVDASERWPDDQGKAELDTLIEQLDLFEFESAKESLEAIKQLIQ